MGPIWQRTGRSSGRLLSQRTDAFNHAVVDVFAVNGVHAAVGPAIVFDAVAFHLGQGDIAPAREVEGEVMIADAAGRGMGGAKHLDIQDRTLAIAVYPEAEAFFASDIEQGFRLAAELGPGPFDGRAGVAGGQQAAADAGGAAFSFKGVAGLYAIGGFADGECFRIAKVFEYDAVGILIVRD